MKSGDIVFIMKKQHWVSRTMARFMQSKWSHTIILKEITEQSHYTVETTDFEVAISDLRPYIGQADVQFEVWSPLNISDDERKAIINRAMSHFGEMYGYFQLLSLGIRRLLMRIGIKIPNFIRQGLVCDQLAIYAYNGSGVPCLTDLDPESIDTQELYEIVSKSGFFEKVDSQG